MEPIEQLVVDIEEVHQGGVMEKLGTRKAQLKNMESDGKGRVRLDYMIPARGLIGFQNEFKTLTQGTGLLFHVFDHYGPKEQGAIRSEEHTSELQSLLRISYAVFCLNNKNTIPKQ